MTKPTVGVVGLGLMGRNIADRLLSRGFEVTGYDVDESAVDAIVDEGGNPASDPADVSGSVDIVITSLPTPEIVEAVYLDDDGIDAGATEGTVACEMSTIDPPTTRRIAEGSSTIDLLDTPVSGGPEDCADGTLMVLAGGNEATFDSDPVQMVLSTLGRQVFYAGPVGSGHTVKLLNNVMSAGNLLLAMEVVAFGVACGIEETTLHGILTSTGGSSKQLEKRLPRVLNRNFEPGFTVEYARKDVNLAVEFAESQDIPAHLSSIVHRFLIEASAAGLDSADMCSVVQLFERHTDVEVKADRPVDESFDGY